MVVSSAVDQMVGIVKAHPAEMSSREPNMVVEWKNMQHNNFVVII